VIKEKSHGCESTKPHLCFVVAPANLCLTCTPHLTGMKYRALLQANNQHFSPILSTKLSYQLVSRHTEFSGQNKGPGGGVQNTVNFTRRCKKAHVESRAKTNHRRTTLFDLSRAELYFIFYFFRYLENASTCKK
jgi:hypothetical protein